MANYGPLGNFVGTAEVKPNAIKLHFGCGLTVGNGWYNCDSSPTLWLQRIPVIGLLARQTLKPEFPSAVHYGDIVAGLPLPPESCDVAFSSHVLEHLSLDDARRALRKTYFYLKKGGVFRLVVPDFRQQVDEYIASPDPKALHNLLTYSGLGRRSRSKGLRDLFQDWLGHQHHLWMWDFNSLSAELADIGFTNIRRCGFGDSAAPEFAEVENESRFRWAVAVECIK